MKRIRKIIAFTLTLALTLVFIPVAAFGAETSVTSLKNTPPAISDSGEYLVMPALSGAEVKLYGSSNKQVVALDGTVHKPLVDTTVQLIYKAVYSDGREVAADYNVSVTIPGEKTKNEGLPKPETVPMLREWSGGEEYFTLTDTSAVIYDKTQPIAGGRAEILSSFFRDMLGLDIPVKTGTPKKGDIVLLLDESLEYMGDEGYIINIGEYITVTAYAPTGLVYGGVSVIQGLKTGDMKFPMGTARDYPEYEIRSGMLDVGRAWIPLDYLYEISRYMAYFKMNEIHLHINDSGANGYSGFRLESDIPGLQSEDGYYTKDEYRKYQKDMLEIGVKVITEIDTPAHSSCFAGTGVPMLDSHHLDISKPETVQFIKDLFDEYISGDDPVIITDIVHIGTDEYPIEYSEQMRAYINELLVFIKERGYTPRFWGAFGSGGFNGKTPVTGDAQALYWAPSLSDYKTLYEYGYDIINMTQSVLYTVPGGNYGFANYIDYEYIYDKWQGHYFDMTGTIRMPEGHPQTKGVAFALWNDLHTEYWGYTRFEIFERFKNGIFAIAEKGWCGTQTNETTGAEYAARVDKLADKAPFSNPLRTIGTTGTVKLDGTQSFDSVGFPYTLSFDLYLDEYGSGNTLFESSDGRIYYNSSGNIILNKEVYDFKFSYVVPKGEKVNIKLTSDSKTAILIIDDTYYYSAVNNKNNKEDVRGLTTSAFVLPVEKINDCVSNAEIVTTAVDISKLKVKRNYALNCDVSVSGLEVNDGRFTAECAVDGIASAQSRLSFSRANDEQWLIVDLGETITFNQIKINFFEHSPEYKIYISDTGEEDSWTEIYHLSESTHGNAVVDVMNFDEINARYIKYQQLKRYYHEGYSTYYSGGIYEFEVYRVESAKYREAIDKALDMMANSENNGKTQVKQALNRLEVYMKDMDSAISPHLEALYNNLLEAMDIFESGIEESQTPVESEPVSEEASSDIKNPEKSSWLPVIITAAAIAVIGLTIGVIIIKKRKKK